MYTKEAILELIQTSDLAVERAVIRLNEIREKNPDAINEFHSKLIEALKIWLDVSDRPIGKRFTVRILETMREILKDSYTVELVKWANEHYSETAET